MTLQKNLDRAATLAFPTQAVIDGKLVGAISGKTFDNIGPRDGKVVSQVAACDAADIDAAVKAARAAFEDGRWRNNGWDACDITVPFGGARQSGFGRDRSLHAMEKYTELKGISVTYKP
jgi:acyl-CoA reductase-like NAD-dependent aldehyde dehydrogenase